MTTWVVDTSPLIFLSKLGRLNLLQAGADTVCVPQSVMDEVRAKPDEATRLIERVKVKALGFSNGRVPWAQMLDWAD